LATSNFSASFSKIAVSAKYVARPGKQRTDYLQLFGQRVVYELKELCSSLPSFQLLCLLVASHTAKERKRVSMHPCPLPMNALI
jgi:hypothetical protein